MIDDDDFLGYGIDLNTMQQAFDDEPFDTEPFDDEDEE